MPPTFFDPDVPRGAQVSRRYLARLQGAAQAASTSLPRLSGPGTVDHNSQGLQFVSDDLQWVFARIIGGPHYGTGSGSGSGSGSGVCDKPSYSWVEVSPTECGGWEDVGAEAGGYSGDFDRQPLYEANDKPGARVGDVYKACRGAFPKDWDHGVGQDWRFWLGGGAAQAGSGSGAAGECCFSGVTLYRYRCQGAAFQRAPYCVRLESGQLLRRDEQCRLWLEDCDCCDGVTIYEADVITSGFPAVTTLQEFTYCLKIRCGRPVLLDSNCEVVGGRECMGGLGVRIRTLECVNGMISPSWVCVTFECGRLVKRDNHGDVVADGACCTDPPCEDVSPGLTWHNTGCNCSAADCGAGNLPATIDWVMQGIGGSCAGLTATGSAHWVPDIGAALGHPTTNYFGNWDGIPGYVFDPFTVNGSVVQLAAGCLDPARPPNGLWALEHTIDMGAGQFEGPGGNISDFPNFPWGADGSDPGAAQFTLDWSFGGLPCGGAPGDFLLFNTASP